MFKTPAGQPPIVGLLARRAGRLGFGVVLLCGAVVLVRGALGDGELGAARILATTWACAIAAGLIAWFVTRRLAHRWPSDALALASLVVPAVGLALVAPLTSHLIVMAPFGLRGFDEWVKLSIAITATAHGAFAVTSACRVISLARGKGKLTVKWVFLIVMLASCVPYIIIVIPPILVGLTGLAMLPIVIAPERIVARERAIVATAPAVAYLRVAR